MLDKTFIVLLIISAILFALLVLAPPANILIQPNAIVARALDTFRKDPSPQNQAEFEHQRARLNRRRLGERVVFLSLLAANLRVLFWVVRRNRSSSRPTPN